MALIGELYCPPTTLVSNVACFKFQRILIMKFQKPKKRELLVNQKRPAVI